MFDVKQLPFTGSAAVLMSLQPILVSMSKNSMGRFDYSVPASTMLSEVRRAPPKIALVLAHLNFDSSRRAEQNGMCRRE